VHAMPCARQWCGAASVAVWRACGMVARVHHALGPLGQQLRQMSVGRSVPDEDEPLGARLQEGPTGPWKGPWIGPAPHQGLLGEPSPRLCAPVLRRGVSSHYRCTPPMPLRRMALLSGCLHTHACIACTGRLASASLIHMQHQSITRNSQLPRHAYIPPARAALATPRTSRSVRGSIVGHSRGRALQGPLG
jgi:hypothetical protein